MKIRKIMSLNLSRKSALTGYLFIMPFIVGLLMFFAYPIFQSLIFSISKLEITPGGFDYSTVGFSNYYRAFMIEADYRRILLESVIDMVSNVPLVIIFSFFTATLLNQKFRGRTLSRAIIFLPVILTSGVIIALEKSDLILNMMQSGGGEGTAGQIISTFELKSYLAQTRLNPQIIEYILGAIDRIYSIIIASGVQILIFIAGLQSISPSLFEASNMEGATGWENFWKITFPMMSPLILGNMVYTIVDSFTNTANPVINMIYTFAFKNSEFGLSSAMAWSYFAIIFLILGVTIALISRKIFYYE